MKSVVCEEKVYIDKIIPGGQALGTLPDGKKIFFWNALPGETVTKFELTKNKHRFAEAVMLGIINPSAHRVKPEDACFLSTSPWQIMDYDYELQLKTELIKENFREHDIALTPPPIVTDGHAYHYRNKMEYALYWDNDTEKISLAFRARGSHSKIPVTQSSLERPEIFAAATKIVENLNHRHEEARKYQSLLLRANQNGDVSGGLFENGQPHPVFPNLTDTILDHEYSYSPNGFFQINLPVYELALQEIKNHITTDNILDLYAGVGTIGLSVARDRHLTLVEADAAAFGELSKNITIEDIVRPTGSTLARNPVTLAPWDANCRRQTGVTKRVRNGNILAILEKSENALNYIAPNQTVILDPPRAGCDIKLLEKLLEVKPQKIIYLSCNPATQARDVKILLDQYKITFNQSFNFFPRTPHIENLIVLSL